MTTRNSYCEHCGGDSDAQARLHQRWYEAERLYKLEASQHGVTKALFELYKIKTQGDESWAQAKVKRQSQQIQKLKLTTVQVVTKRRVEDVD